MAKEIHTIDIKEQCPDARPVEIKVNILSEGGQIWIQPEGYGEKCALDGQGWPVGGPQIIDLENARECHRFENL